MVDVAHEKPAIDQEDATKVASAEFGMVNGRRPTEMALARVTNEGTKNFLEADLPAGGPDKSRILDNRLAWVVVYDGVTIPHSGGPAPPPGVEKQRLLVEPFRDSFMVLVDATTGKYISGESVIRQHPVAKNPG